MKKSIFVVLLAFIAFPAVAQENMTFGHQNQNNNYQVIQGGRKSTTVIVNQRKCRVPPNIINKSINEINGMKFNHAVRIIRPNQPVTMDYNPDRLNIILDQRDYIRELRCG